jgi:Domain of unknown function (DUF4269)
LVNGTSLLIGITPTHKSLVSNRHNKKIRIQRSVAHRPKAKYKRMMINFLDISYLQFGYEKQVRAYQVLMDNKILEKLAFYNPILVGTIPINIDIENSDLDIICEVYDNDEFIDQLMAIFGHEKDFSITQRKRFNAIKATFKIEDFEIEIFGQDRPTMQQNAYRHMLIEYKLLLEKGEAFRQEIISLKNQGYKTEPAFAKLLKLEGDAYQELLKLQSQNNARDTN